MSVRPTPIHYKCSRAGLSLHTTAADDWPEPTHTHTQRRTLTHSHVTHSSYHTQRHWNSERRWEMLPAGNHWVSPLSLCAPLSFPVCLCCDCHSAARLSSFISHTLLCRCEMASVFSDWETFQTFLSVCRAHTLLSSPCLSFFSLHVNGDRSKSWTYLHVGAEPESDLPLCLNGRV